MYARHGFLACDPVERDQRSGCPPFQLGEYRDVPADGTGPGWILDGFQHWCVHKQRKFVDVAAGPCAAPSRPAGNSSVLSLQIPDAVPNDIALTWLHDIVCLCLSLAVCLSQIVGIAGGATRIRFPQVTLGGQSLPESVYLPGYDTNGWRNAAEVPSPPWPNPPLDVETPPQSGAYASFHGG
jgi:hypothetical protein